MAAAAPRDARSAGSADRSLAASPPCAAAVASTRAAAADLAGSCGGLSRRCIIFCAVYFHSKTDPGTRFAIRSGHITNYGPSWFQDQQKFGQFTPGDLAVIAFAYLGADDAASRKGRLHVSEARRG